MTSDDHTRLLGGTVKFAVAVWLLCQGGPSAQSLEKGILRIVERHQTYRGQASTGLFHRSSCPATARIGKDDLVILRSQEAARRRAFRPCAGCLGPSTSSPSPENEGLPLVFGAALALLGLLAAAGAMRKRRQNGPLPPPKAVVTVAAQTPPPKPGITVSLPYPLGEVRAWLAESNRTLIARAELAMAATAANDNPGGLSPDSAATLREQLGQSLRSELDNKREQLVGVVRAELSNHSYQHFLSPQLKRALLDKIRQSLNAVIVGGEVTQVLLAEARCVSVRPVTATVSGDALRDADEEEYI